jgi:hypothetical protein
VKDIKRQTWLYGISAFVLLLGIVSAICIYQAAINEPSNETGYDIVGGKIYPGGLNSKKYVHDLQVYGGQAAVMADQITRWFAGLWAGTQLAYTVGWLSFFLALVFLIAARSSTQK